MTGGQKPLVKIQRAELVNFKRAPTALPLLARLRALKVVPGVAAMPPLRAA